MNTNFNYVSEYIWFNINPSVPLTHQWRIQYMFYNSISRYSIQFMVNYEL